MELRHFILAEATQAHHKYAGNSMLIKVQSIPPVKHMRTPLYSCRMWRKVLQVCVTVIAVFACMLPLN
ncbi:MAG TPA: hypothetical protein V6D19_15210, partial [Stenomitos sp.]